MALPTYTGATNYIRVLVNKVKGEADNLKYQWDRFGDEFKTWFNGTFISALNSEFTTKTEITTNRKLSSTGDFTGTLNGAPITAAEPGLTSIVNAHLAENAKFFPLSTGGDDTAMIQGILNDNPDYGEFVFPGNTYNISGLTIARDNVKIRGQKNTVLKCNTVATSFITLDGENNTLESIEIDCNRKASRGIAILPDSNDITIQASKIINGFDNGKSEVVTGIYGQGDTDGLTIKDCIIDSFEATPNSVEGDDAGASRAIWLFQFPSQSTFKNVLISHNKISNIIPREDGDGIHVSGELNSEDDNNIIIEKNTFTHCAKRAIKAMASGVKLNENYVVNDWPGVNGDWSDGMYAAISIYSSHVDVTNNVIRGTSFQYPISINPGATYWSKKITIDNNTIVCAEGGTTSPYQGVIQAEGEIDGLTISNNKISGGLYGAYLRTKTSNVVINKNTFEVTNSGIRLSNDAGYVSATHHIYANNTIICNQYGIHIQLSDAVDVAIIGNMINSGYEAILSETVSIIRVGNTGTYGKGVFIPWGTTLPTANKYTWTQLFQKYNTGADDTIHICIRVAAGTYAWKQLTLS